MGRHVSTYSPSSNLLTGCHGGAAASCSKPINDSSSHQGTPPVGRRHGDASARGADLCAAHRVLLPAVRRQPRRRSRLCQAASCQLPQAPATFWSGLLIRGGRAAVDLPCVLHSQCRRAVGVRRLPQATSAGVEPLSDRWAVERRHLRTTGASCVRRASAGSQAAATVPPPKACGVSRQHGCSGWCRRTHHPRCCRCDWSEAGGWRFCGWRSSFVRRRGLG